MWATYAHSVEKPFESFLLAGSSDTTAAVGNMVLRGEAALEYADAHALMVVLCGVLRLAPRRARYYLELVREEDRAEMLNQIVVRTA